MAGSCEQDNEYLGTMNVEFLDCLSDYWLPKKDCSPWSWLVHIYMDQLQFSDVRGCLSVYNRMLIGSCLWQMFTQRLAVKCKIWRIISVL